MKCVAPAGLCLLLACGVSPGPPGPSPQATLQGVAALLDSAVAAGAAPGAVLGVSFHGQHFFHGSGRLGQDDPRRPDESTIYDLASLTKVVGLTTAVMLGVQDRRLDLDDPVTGISSREPVTLRHLLTHSSGLPAWRPLFREAGSRRAAFDLAESTALDTLPGARYTYSDLGAIWMTDLVERAYGIRLDSLLARRVFGPLGLADTRYLPPAVWRARIAPTEDDPWRGRVLRGEVHDENAARMDGVSGHAGLFSSARDLLRFGDWLLHLQEPGRRGPGSAGCGDEGAESSAGGSPSGPDLPAALCPPPAALVSEFTRPQQLPSGSSRALGWDTPSPGSSAGTLLSPRSYGHTGFTGTSIWIDPGRELVIVLLSNRVHPSRENSRWGPVRAAVADRVVQALGAGGLTR